MPIGAPPSSLLPLALGVQGELRSVMWTQWGWTPGQHLVSSAAHVAVLCAGCVLHTRDDRLLLTFCRGGA